MIQHALAIILTGGVYEMPPDSKFRVPASGSAISVSGQYVDISASLRANTGSPYHVTCISCRQAELWHLLSEWNELDSNEVDEDYAARKFDLDRNSVSFKLP
jgi:hypothetical protein